MKPQNGVWAGIAAIWLVTPLHAAEAATPVAEARKLVRRVISVKNPRDLPQIFTNETAAGMGIMFGAMVAMTGAMAEAMAGAVESMAEAVGQGLGTATGETAGEPGNDAVGDGIAGEEAAPDPVATPKPAPKPSRDPRAAAQMARVKAVTKEIEQIFRKYGLPMEGPGKPLTPQERRRVAASGRAMLAEVIRVIDKLPNSKGGPDKGMLMPRQDIRPDKLKYRQISRTRVQITDPSSPKTRVEARLEAGVWRLHMADAARILDGKGLEAPAAP